MLCFTHLLDYIIFLPVLVNVLLVNYKDADFFVYQGSSTVPPCVEEVQWIVLAHPARCSQAQLRAYQNAVEQAGLQGGNARPTQPRNSRKIEYTDKQRRAARLAMIVFLVSFVSVVGLFVTCRQKHHHRAATAAESPSPESSPAASRVYRNA